MPLCRLVWCGLTAADKKQIGMDGSKVEEGALLAIGKIVISTRVWETDNVGARFIEFAFRLMQAANPNSEDLIDWPIILTKNGFIDSIESGCSLRRYYQS